MTDVRPAADRMTIFPSLFSMGFRPFFLGAGALAIVLIIEWLATLSGLVGSLPFEPVTWHVHEMLFGFAAAPIAGFLLTAVPNWTASTPIRGWPLASLFMLWLAARIGMAPGVAVAPQITAAVDVAFFPVLGIFLAPALLRARNWRNVPFLGLLAALSLANLLFHLDRLNIVPGGALAGRMMAIDLVVLIVAVIGGRIIPSFTINAVRWPSPNQWPRSSPVLERVAIGLLIVMFGLDLMAPGSLLLAAVSGCAAVAHVLRLAQWKGWRTLDKPILWVLHLGYLWLPIGLALKAIWLVWAPNFAASWVHALTIGLFSTMILAMMSRVALGHTGRPLKVSPIIVIAYGLVTLAALSRLAAGALPALHGPLVDLAGLLWIATFLLFLSVYAPILVAPRADGRT